MEYFTEHFYKLIQTTLHFISILYKWAIKG